jgi:hypothetical protein
MIGGVMFGWIGQRIAFELMVFFPSLHWIMGSLGWIIGFVVGLVIALIVIKQYVAWKDEQLGKAAPPDDDTNKPSFE